MAYTPGEGTRHVFSNLSKTVLQDVAPAEMIFIFASASGASDIETFGDFAGNNCVCLQLLSKL